MKPTYSETVNEKEGEMSNRKQNWEVNSFLLGIGAGGGAGWLLAKLCGLHNADLVTIVLVIVGAFAGLCLGLTIGDKLYAAQYKEQAFPRDWKEPDHLR